MASFEPTLQPELDDETFDQAETRSFINSVVTRLASINALKELEVTIPFEEERNRQIFKKKLALYQKVWLKVNTLHQDFDSELRLKLEQMLAYLAHVIANEEGVVINSRW